MGSPSATSKWVVPQDLLIFIGVCEFLGDIGLIVPAMTAQHADGFKAKILI
jgi:hypothetical protein